MIRSGRHQLRLVEVTQDRTALLALSDRPRLHVLPKAHPAKAIVRRELVRGTAYPTTDPTPTPVSMSNISKDHMECQKGLRFQGMVQSLQQTARLPITVRCSQWSTLSG